MSNPLSKIYHDKQYTILERSFQDFFMLINHGAKRTGKTILNNDLFLFELKRVREIADRENVQKPQYILAGADLGALQRNVLAELTNKYEIEFNFDKHNRFELFGVTVCCFGHSKANDKGRIRGMTAYGAYINEGSMANEEVFNEIISRCSGTGARILIDTNPDIPDHWLKRDYIDKADGDKIIEYSYQLDDNTFLSDRYRENIKATTPTGVFYDRNILGKWTAGEGVIYKDFNAEVHYIKAEEVPRIIKHYAGVDWGYTHTGVIVVVGEDKNGVKYLLEEHAHKNLFIDQWKEIAHKVIDKYGYIPFYCDTARPEHIVAFKKDRINAKNGAKSVIPGIEYVAKLYRTNKLYIVRENVDIFDKEIQRYSWLKGENAPVKEHDDVQDAIRYALYSNKIVTEGV